jgi:hypothetical protein
MTKSVVNITERGYRESCLGQVLQLKVFADDFRPLSWREIWAAFVQRYPDRWAVQTFPPEGQVVDAKNVYHLFLCEGCPDGLNLHT